MLRLIAMAALLCSLFFVSHALKVGDKACFQAGLRLRVTPCGSVVATSTGSEHGSVLAVQTKSCEFGSYTWIQVNLTGVGKVWAAQETGLVSACASNGGSKVLNVPYVNQRWDTPDNFGGSWACGPTSAVMAMAYFGKIHLHPITCSSPTPHTSDFGWYVPNIYTSPTGFTFNRMQTDSAGHPAYGAWGTCTDGGGAWAWRIQDYARNHGLAADFYDTATFQLVKTAIDSGNLVILSTQLSSAGHIILVRGYNADGSIVVNDPWGNANLPGWPANGNGVTYKWAFPQPKWCIVIRKASSQAELESLPFPAPKDVVEYDSIHNSDW